MVNLFFFIADQEEKNARKKVYGSHGRNETQEMLSWERLMGKGKWRQREREGKGRVQASLRFRWNKFLSRGSSTIYVWHALFASNCARVTQSSRRVNSPAQLGSTCSTSFSLSLHNKNVLTHVAKSEKISFHIIFIHLNWYCAMQISLLSQDAFRFYLFDIWYMNVLTRNSIKQEKSIEVFTRAINADTCKAAIRNFAARIRECLVHRGAHIEHVIQAAQQPW